MHFSFRNPSASCASPISRANLSRQSLAPSFLRQNESDLEIVSAENVARMQPCKSQDVSRGLIRQDRKAGLSLSEIEMLPDELLGFSAGEGDAGKHVSHDFGHAENFAVKCRNIEVTRRTQDRPLCHEHGLEFRRSVD